MSIPESLQQDKQDKLENHNGNIIRHAIALSKAIKTKARTSVLTSCSIWNLEYYTDVITEKIFRFLCCL